MIFTHHCSLIKHHISFAAGKPVSPETCPRTFSPGTRMMRKLLAEPVTSTASSTQAGTTMKTSCMRSQGQGVKVTCLESQARRHARMNKAWASNVLTQKDSLTTRNLQRQKHSEIRMGWQAGFMVSCRNLLETVFTCPGVQPVPRVVGATKEVGGSYGHESNGHPDWLSSCRFGRGA